MNRQSFKQFIKNRYGNNIFENINNFQTAYVNIELLNEDIYFLSKCKGSGITPIHCRIGGRRSVSPTTKKFIKSTEKKLLNRSITKNYSKRWKFTQVKNKADKLLEEILCIQDYLQVAKLTEKKYSNKIHFKRRHLLQKFEKLLKERFKNYSTVTLEEKSQHQNKTLLNFSNIEIPEEFRPLLSKGLEFKLATKKLPIVDMVCNIEEAVKQFCSPAMANDLSVSE